MGVLPMHLGAAHAIEWVLSIALVVGPLIALAVVIVAVRRRDEREDEAESAVADENLRARRSS